MKKKTRRLILVLAVVGVGLVCPYLLIAGFMGAGSVLGWIDKKIYEDKSAFSSEEWRGGNRKTRFAYIDVLLADDVLKDKTQAEVSELLGEPDWINEERIWCYETERPGWRFIDFSGGGISVEFDESLTVKEVKDTRWID